MNVCSHGFKEAKKENWFDELYIYIYLHGKGIIYSELYDVVRWCEAYMLSMFLFFWFPLNINFVLFFSFSIILEWEIKAPFILFWKRISQFFQ